MIIYLERGANDLHMVQPMPLPPHRLCFSKIQNGLTFCSSPGLSRTNGDRTVVVAVVTCLRVAVSQRHSLAFCDVVQSRRIEPVKWSAIGASVHERFAGLPAFANCTFNISARPSQGGLPSPWTSYTHLTSEQGADSTQL